MVFLERSLEPVLLALPTRLNDNRGLIKAEVAKAVRVCGLELPLRFIEGEEIISGGLLASFIVTLVVFVVVAVVVILTMLPLSALFSARGDTTVGASTTLLTLFTAQERACLHTRWASKATILSYERAERVLISPSREVRVGVRESSNSLSFASASTHVQLEYM